MAIVATCPLAGAQNGLLCGPRVRLPSKENVWSRHQHLFEENVWKTKKTMVCVFWKWGFGSCLRIGKVLAPHALVTRDDNLQSSVQIWLKNYVFSFFMFLSIFPFFIFFLSFFAFYVFYFFVVDKGVSFAPTYPQLRWGNQTYVIF